MKPYFQDDAVTIFKQLIEEIIKVKHDDMTDDECIKAILAVHNAELDRIAEELTVKTTCGQTMTSYSQGFKEGANHAKFKCQAYIQAQKKAQK